MGDFLDIIKNKKHLTSLLVLGIIILALPIGIKLVKEQQLIQSRAQGEPIDFNGGVGVSLINGEWVATSNVISFRVFSRLGPPRNPALVTPSPGSYFSTPTPTPTPTPPNYAPADTITIPLSAGWNLISFPRPLRNPPISSTFTGFNAVEKVYYNNPNKSTNDKWDHAFYKDNSWTGPLSQLEAGKAYWVQATADVEIPVKVEAASSSRVVRPPVLPNSWNMIGYSTLTNGEMDVKAYLSSVGLSDWKRVYKYYKGTWVIAALEGPTFQVKVGEGYWIDVGAVSGIPVLPPDQSPYPGVVCGGTCTSENSRSNAYICHNISTPQTPQLVWRDASCPEWTDCSCPADPG